MEFTFGHVCFYVLDLEKSLEFYSKALGLTEVRRREAKDGSFTLVFLGDGVTGFSLELTYMKDRTEPYDLGDNETHLAFVTDDIAASLIKHKEMDCVCFENPDMGIYFIEDPDGYWLEIVPKR